MLLLTNLTKAEVFLEKDQQNGKNNKKKKADFLRSAF